MASIHNDEDPAEESEEEELVCDECFREMDELEVEDLDEDVKICIECAASIRASRVRQKLPSNLTLRKVTGNHTKSCSDCGKGDWMHGDYYVYDEGQPWGTDKFCLDCADTRDWGTGTNWGDSDEDDVGDILIGSAYARQQEARNASYSASVMFNPGCHTGGDRIDRSRANFPFDVNRHPTAGTIHIGGMSSVMMNPGLSKKTRHCERSCNGRKCSGKIQSFTDDGFQFATCSVCYLPQDEGNNQTAKRETEETQASNKRQRI